MGNRLLFWVRTVFQCRGHELLLRRLLKGTLNGVGPRRTLLGRNVLLDRFRLPAGVQTRLAGRSGEEGRRFEARVCFRACAEHLRIIFVTSRSDKPE